MPSMVGNLDDDMAGNSVDNSVGNSNSTADHTKKVAESASAYLKNSHDKVWVDTGFLVALFARNDSYHDDAKAFIKDNQGIEMHSIWPVIVETCFFLNNQGKQALLEWLERGAMVMHEITTRDTPQIRKIIKTYHNIEPDFTDATLVALAGQSKVRSILTVDQRDFSIYRFSDGSTFERLWVK